MNINTQILEKYIPSEASAIVSRLLDPHELELRIVRNRTTKYGDFNPSVRKKKMPLITINNNLNPYSFLITLLHEFAHYLVWKDGHLYAKPHCRTWKNHFRQLMETMMNKEVFPESMLPLLKGHMQDPCATSCTDVNLFKELSNFDSDRPGVYIEDLPDGMVFHTDDDQLYRKEKKIRKRILCTRLKNNKKYLFSPIYKVFPLKNKQYVMVFPFVFIFLLHKQK